LAFVFDAVAVTRPATRLTAKLASCDLELQPIFPSENSAAQLFAERTSIAPQPNVVRCGESIENKQLLTCVYIIAETSDYT
jgi:hypothetical protein